MLAVLWVIMAVFVGNSMAEWNSFRGGGMNWGFSDQDLIESANVSWEVQLAMGWIDPAAIIHNRSVFVFTNGDYDFNTGRQITPSTLVRLDERNGTTIWSRKVSESKVQLSSPGICGETIAVGSSDGKLYAFNASSGAADFKFRCRPSTYGITSSPKPLKDGWIFAGGDGYVYRLDLSGQSVWECDTGDDVYFSSAALHSGRAYIGNDGGNLSCIDIESGERFWAHNVSGRIRTSPTVLDDMVIFAWNEYSGNMALDGWLRAVDRDGKFVWETHIGAGISSPATDGENIYVGSNENVLYCMTIDGEVKWRFHANGPVQSSPAVARNGIFFTSNIDRDGNRSTLYFIDGDGNELFTYVMTPAQWALSSPAIGDGCVVFASDNGKVYCISDGLSEQRSSTSHGNVKDGDDHEGMAEGTGENGDERNSPCEWSFMLALSAIIVAFAGYRLKEE